MSAWIRRRPLLVTGLASLTAPVLVACGDDETASAGSDTESGTGSETESGSGSGSGSDTDTGSGQLPAVADVPVGGAVSAKTGAGEPIIVAQPSPGEIVAFTAVCTHKGCTVKPAGAKLECPCHGSVFDALTGENVSGPAPSPLASVPVKVEGDQVVEG